jgi:ribosomal protein S6--L-glutamate ligase
LIVNTWASTSSCQDRVTMAQRMRTAGLPWPRTWSLATLESLLAHPELGVSVPLPLVLKSRYSRHGDLVVKVDRVEQVQALAARWGREPIIVQELVSGDGWDIKVWVIDHQVWATRRRTALEAQTPAENIPVGPEELPRAWVHLALEIGQVFNLRLYGVDLLIAEQGPVAVDVNAFPGFRGVPGASSALVALVEQIGRARRITA